MQWCRIKARDHTFNQTLTDPWFSHVHFIPMFLVVFDTRIHWASFSPYCLKSKFFFPFSLQQFSRSLLRDLNILLSSWILEQHRYWISALLIFYLPKKVLPKRPSGIKNCFRNKQSQKSARIRSQKSSQVLYSRTLSGNKKKLCNPQKSLSIRLNRSLLCTSCLFESQKKTASSVHT